MRWVFFLLFFLVGCAHGGQLFAFPAGSDAPTNPPPPTSSDEPTPSIIRARIRTRATTADINRTACSLRPTLSIDGESQPVDVFIGGVTPCAAMLEGALRVNVRILASDNGGREAVLELLVPQGATPRGAEDMKNGLREVEREMARRLASIERAQVSTDLPPIEPREEPRRRSAKVMLVSEIVWAVTGAFGATGVVMILGGV